MAGVRHFTVLPSESGMRLDRWFRTYFPLLGHAALEKLLRKGLIRIDGGRSKANMRLDTAQKIRVPPEVDQTQNTKKTHISDVPKLLANQLKASIIHKDKRVIVLNKPSGLAVQGGSKTFMHVDAGLAALKFELDDAPRLVHRLDRDTSGVLVLGRDRAAAQILTQAFACRAAVKIYWALVHGAPRVARGRIDVALVKCGVQNNGERVHPATGKEKKALRAITDYVELARVGQKFSWLAFLPTTGRTHQIRVHSVAIGHPIVGDGKYRSPQDSTKCGGGVAKKLHLHARSIMIPHPDGGMLEVVAPLTGHMADTWRALGLAADNSDNPF